jgi:hypothetical protein
MIELCEVGPLDGDRGTVCARHLDHGLLTPEREPPSVADLADPARWADDPAYRQVLWRWDGTTADDGTFRFRRAD